MKIVLSVFVLLSFAIGSSGCDEADNVVDCFDVCERYDDCVNDNVNNADCTTQCSDQANANENYEDELEACSNCLDENDDTCVDSTVCAVECAVVIPEIAE